MRVRWIVLLTVSIAVLAGTMVWAFAGSTVTSVLGFGGAERDTDEDFGAVVVHDVDVGGILSPEPDRRAREVWDEFTRVVTPDFAAATIRQYRVGDNPDSDTLAYVYRDADPRLWVFAANLAYADDPDLLLSTLVHEYAHILSLGADDTDHGNDSCETVQTNEGCLRPEAALASFQQRFWSGYEDAPDPDNDDPDRAWEFYQDHEDDFVSDYAATNVAEDFAESFMTYVLEERSDADTVIGEKLRFFDGQPEYAEARDRIRTEFAFG
ncbi:NADH:ubiquinone oxidoreductase subunit 4 (chain M) [Microbacterium enclense]|uniref:NADH:ubiquinone oxidoreductase subunit 4 (chain M) n=1 Tax=Microbacterium enclense TaxID=993073 RepID=UPI0036D93F6F